MRTISRIILTLGVALGLALWSAPRSYAQGEQPQIKITQVDNSKFPQVTVYVSVTNAAGEPVGVDPATIQISENGQVMQPTNMGGGGQGGVGPLTTMLVMDVSGSMDKNNKIVGAKAAAKAYVNQMRPGDQAGLIIYNTHVTYTQDLTQNHESLTNAIDNIKTGGDTAMFDALIQAEEELKNVSGRKAIIVVTDGLDNSSSHGANDVVSGVGQGGLSISTIGLGDSGSKAQNGLDEVGLKSLAQQAGGAYSYAGDSQSLSSLFQLYGRTLQSEYAITYTSPSSLRDGVNRNLTVSLNGAAPATVQGKYNPGGVLPEVSGSSWLLFGGILVGLLVLLFVPIVIGMINGGSGGGFSLGGGRKKGRIKLTSGAGGGQPVSAARGRVKIK
jgi:VWFA-related protein